LPIILALVFFVPQISYEHQDGCHRWHSCPSDSGSYVCGDLGYDTFCPKQQSATSTESQTIKKIPIITETLPIQDDDNKVSENLEFWKNIRYETVLVFSSSVDELLERGYLVSVVKE